MAVNLKKILSSLSLEEKVGQLTLGVGDLFHTGPAGPAGKEDDAKRIREDIRHGLVGGLVNVRNVKVLRTIQEEAISSSSQNIPLVFGNDVIHGCFVQFPIPLAEASSFDINFIERSARYAAKEAAATGIHWTFAPMVDICEDPRWGAYCRRCGRRSFLGVRSRTSACARFSR